jgi:DNA helicase IV
MTQKTNYVLSTVDSYGEASNAIEYKDSVLISIHDVKSLLANLDETQDISQKQSLIKRYILVNERISCIIDNIKESATNTTSLKCEGDELVSELDQYGLPGVDKLYKQIMDTDSEQNKHKLLQTYIGNWENGQRIIRVEQSLLQSKRTHEIILFGKLLKKIHKFPILYKGEILVPIKDLEDLIQNFGSLTDKKEQRNLVIEYLDKTSS